MSNRKLLALAAVAVMLALTFPMLAVAQEHGDTNPTRLSKSEKTFLKAILRQSIEPGRATPAQRDAVKHFRRLMKKTLNATPNDLSQLESNWNTNGWQLKQSPDNQFLVVQESPEQRQGRGVYVIDQRSTSSLVLQAPHRFNDRKTGLIARKLLEEHDIKAVAWNTLHRREVDLAHTDRHYLNAFTEAVVEHNPLAVQVQLHGFAPGKRQQYAKDASVIISDTTKFPGQTVRRSAAELKRIFDADSVLLFPLEVNELGGQTNEQARAAHAVGSPRFIHIELDSSFRNRLVDHVVARQQFFAGIAASCGDIAPR